MRIAIVGLGLIGTSVALATRRAQPETELVGVDRVTVIRQPRIVDTFTIASTDLGVIGDTDLVILSTPVDAILSAIPRLGQFVSSRATILDTGSTKRRIVEAARASKLQNFVGGHPMAGAAEAGPDAARADLFDGRPWFLVAPHGANEHVDAARAFVTLLGARAATIGDDHDRVMAAISHLPQVVASALMVRVGQTAGGQGLQLAGAGLRDTTRLAASSADVWTSILASNADELGPLLTQLADDLRQIAGQLDDPTAMKRLFEAANRWKSQT